WHCRLFLFQRQRTMLHNYTAPADLRTADQLLALVLQVATCCSLETILKVAVGDTAGSETCFHSHQRESLDQALTNLLVRLRDALAEKSAQICVAGIGGGERVSQVIQMQHRSAARRTPHDIEPACSNPLCCIGGERLIQSDGNGRRSKSVDSQSRWD